MVELQRLSFLNRDALERGSGGPLSPPRAGGVYTNALERVSGLQQDGLYRGSDHHQDGRDQDGRVSRGSGYQQDGVVSRGSGLQQDGGVYRDQRSKPVPPPRMPPQQERLVYRDSQDHGGVVPSSHPSWGVERAVHNHTPQVKSLYSISDGYGGSSTLV